ncbi:hypothetical protein AB0M19_25095 [Streptomyces sp. NPDC051920]|uniref:hypothetical protein n=1 Tax=Streptomyces sp. NPDC051920 TaxID=3155523 RepID=UPI0034359B77
MTESKLSAGRGHALLEETAWLHRAGQGCPEDLPMTAAVVLAAGVDSPTLCELAGLSRDADPRDIRDAFEQALVELGIALPDQNLARRFALRRVAEGFVAGAMAVDELVSDDWWEVDTATAQEREFVALIPQCTCCLQYTLGLDQEAWETRLRIAALALVASPAIGPDSR